MTTREPLQTKTYAVSYGRDETGWWVASVEGLAGCHTQGRTIAQTRERIREAMSLWDVPETAELDEVIRLGREIDGDLEALRTLRTEADRLAAESSERTRGVARRLARAGFGLRDVGELLGVSFQRAAQLIK